MALYQEERRDEGIGFWTVVGASVLGSVIVGAVSVLITGIFVGSLAKRVERLDAASAPDRTS